MSVYVPSITNKFGGKIKYGKDFVELLEQELNEGAHYLINGDSRATKYPAFAEAPKYYNNGAVFSIEGKVYTARVSYVRSLNNDEGDIGSCFRMKLGERKSKEEIEDVLSDHGIILSDNRILRKLKMLKYNRIMDTSFIDLTVGKKADRRILREINTPKRMAYFTVIQEEDEDALPIHKGQRIIPQRLTTTTHWDNERLLCKKDELQKYPIIEIR